MSLNDFARRRALLSLLGAAVLFGVLQQSSTGVAAQGLGADRTNVLITFANTPGPADAALVRAAGGQVRYAYHLVPGMAATLPTQAVAALRNNPNVLAIEPDVRIEAYDAELDLAWGVGHIGAGAAHAGGVTGAGVRVAAFDSGVEYTHPDLSPVYAGGWDFANDDDDPFDDNGHGTHVSGTIAAADDELGVVGVAPGVQLYAIKILNGAGQGDFSDVIAGLQWAVDNGIQVANHSYGSSSDPGQLVAQAFANAAAAGLVNVAAAGNTGNCRGTGNNVGYPARYSQVIAVAATDSLDNRACFSSTGPAVELSAPGDVIVSTYLNGQYAYSSGTSMASPHVTGVAALLVGAGAADAATVRSLMTSTARDLGAAGTDKLYGYGLVDTVAALAAAGPPPAAVHAALSTDKVVYDPSETSAILTVSVTNAAGAAITGMLPEAFVTALDGAAVATTFVESSTSGTYTAPLDISSLADGQHAVTVQATDGPYTGSDTAAIHVGSQPEPGIVTVSSISYSGQGGRDGYRDVYITATTVDGNGAPVPGATVALLVYINGAPWAFGQAVTGPNGQVTFGAQNAPSGTYYTEVWGVSAPGLIWDGTTPPNTFTKQ